MHTLAKLTITLLFISPRLLGQNSEIKTKLDVDELKMTFPSIYFKHNSTDYAAMTYTADSCFKYIALHIKDINDLVIWRDSLEAEKLTKQRIKKLKAELRKYKATGVYIESMGKEQKISRRTIEVSADTTQIKYLLSLNSVFDIAKTRLRNKASIKTHKVWQLPCWMNWHLNTEGRKRCKTERRSVRTQQTTEKKEGKTSHIEHPRIWCLKCWQKGRFSKDYRRLNEKRNSDKNTSVDK